MELTLAQLEPAYGRVASAELGARAAARRGHSAAGGRADRR